MSTKTRIEYIDLAKGLCIILVVIYHMIEYYSLEMPLNNFFKAFRLPLYFFLSGMFFKKYNGFYDFLRRKVNKLIVPFIFWFLFLSVFVSSLLSQIGIVLWSTRSITIWDKLTDWITAETFPNAPIWFILCLFEVNILFYLCLIFTEKKKKGTLMLFISCLLGGGIGILLWYFKVNLPIYIDSSFTALPFFMFGYLVTRKTKLLVPQSWDKYLLPIIAALFLLVYLFAPFYSLKYNKLNILSIFTMYPCGLLGTMGVVFLAKLIKRIPVIVYWGRYSIMILISHGLIYRLLSFYIPYLDKGNGNFSVLLANLCLTFTICTALIPFFIKYMPYVTAQKDLISIKD